MIHAGEKKSANGDQGTPVNHPRVSTAGVENSVFHPKLGVFMLSTAEQILLCSNGATERSRIEACEEGDENQCKAIRGQKDVSPSFHCASRI